MKIVSGPAALYAAPIAPIITVRADELERGDILDEGVALWWKEILAPDPIVRWLAGHLPYDDVENHRAHPDLVPMEWRPDEMVKIIRPPKWLKLGECQ